MRRYWSEYKSTEFSDIDPLKTIAILPTAAIEQHGPHLPVGVDAMINQGLLDMLCEKAPDELDFCILPLQTIGKSNEHLYAGGTLTLPASTVIEMWTEIGLSVARAGIRKIVFVNSHGGNKDVIGIVAQELRVRAGMFVAKAHWNDMGFPSGLYSEDELKNGLHGGDLETSLMLHFQPDLVDMAQAQNFMPSWSVFDGSQTPQPTGRSAYSWIAADLNPAGVVGNASLATEEKGRVTAEHQVRGLVDFLKEIRDFDIRDFYSAD